MYQCIRTTKNLIPCSRPHLRNVATPPSRDIAMPKYRERADRFNNPYRDLFGQNKGKKPTTFRDRYIEAKRNEPKPSIGFGDDPKNFLNIGRGAKQKKWSFYNDGSRVKFSDVGIIPELAREIAELGAVYPTHHQCDVIPVLLKNKNCVFISPTGSGKTYTYLLPIVQNLIASKKEGYITKSGAPRIIIMAPTKFLALQIGLVTEHLIQEFELRSVCLTELTSKNQSQEIKGHPIDILIGTYDNLTSWISSGNVSTSDLQHLVVDEADDFMDYRKIAENEAFLKEFVDQENGLTKCQIILAGAIMHTPGFKRVTEMVPGIERYLNPRSHVPLQHVQQRFCFVNNRKKPFHIIELLQNHIQNSNSELQRPLIFCNFANSAYWLHKHLIAHDINNLFIGGSADSKTKTRLMRDEIPNTDYPIVTTDSFGYGLDIREIGLVINYEFPFTYEDYIRRIGRTGRMSSNSHNCEAVSYVSYKKDKALFNIVKNSTAQNECLATMLLSTNKYGWYRN